MKQENVARMGAWLLAALVCYAASIAAGTENPQLQLVLWKSGHVTLLAWIGYWISRQALGRVWDDTDGLRVVARAVLIGCVILAGSLGV